MQEMSEEKFQDDPNRIDAPEADYLFVQISQLPNAGEGLFSAITILKDEIIAIYGGSILNEIEALRKADENLDKYFINLPDGTILDSMESGCFARYANDAIGVSVSKFKNNSKISLDENGNVCLVASRKIKSGEEIFCSYGKKYWALHG